MYNDGLLTFVAESCFVLVESLQSHSLTQQVQELVEGGSPLLIVVHLLLGLLARPAVHHPYLVRLLVTLLVQPHQLLLTWSRLNTQVKTENIKYINLTDLAI